MRILLKISSIDLRLLKQMKFPRIIVLIAIKSSEIIIFKDYPFLDLLSQEGERI